MDQCVFTRSDSSRATLYIRGIPFSIVGVTAYSFVGVDAGHVSDFWIPLQTRPELNAWGFPGDTGTLYTSPKWWAVPMVARFAPAVSPEQASEAVQGVFWYAATSPLGKLDSKQWPASLGFVPIRGIADYAKSYREPVQLMMALVGLVLVIACTNLTLLILARCAARQREFAIRIATGARPTRILGQLVAESLVIVGAGATLGWLLAIGATGMLARWARIDAGLNPDRNVLLFTMAIASLVAVAFSLTPFTRAMQISLDQALRSTTQTSTQGRSRARVGNLVIAVQIALCFTLLVAEGLTVRTLLNYERVDLGMKADQLLIFDVDPQGLTRGIQSWSYYKRLMDAIRAIPGVKAVSAAQWRPGSGWLRSGGVLLDGTLLISAPAGVRISPQTP